MSEEILIKQYRRDILKLNEELVMWIDTVNEYKQENTRLRKALKVCEKVIAQIWDCKYESDKIHIFIHNLFGIVPDDLLRKHRGDLYNISKEDRMIATEALKEGKDEEIPRTSTR